VNEQCLEGGKGEVCAFKGFKTDISVQLGNIVE